MSFFEKLLVVSAEVGVVSYLVGKVCWRSSFTPFAPRRPTNKRPSYLLDDHDQSVVMTRELDDTRRGE